MNGTMSKGTTHRSEEMLLPLHVWFEILILVQYLGIKSTFPKDVDV